MTRTVAFAALAALTAAVSLPAFADNVEFAEPHARVSQHDATSTVVDGDRVIIYYGRPHTNDPKTGEARAVWGKLVPWGEVWRTGADEATLLLTGKTITLGSGSATLKLAPGVYSLWTVPLAGEGSKLIVNSQYALWGTQYDSSHDIGSVPLQKDTLSSPLHQFTMQVKKTGGSTGVIKLVWEDLQFSVPFTVGD
ncbi:MAG TPA: DUF2911 domain-containing protein [Opitutaceae bacterium]|jgi:hypothetical protein